MSCLYVLDFNHIKVISSANIFAHSVGFLFILSMVSFSVQVILRLIQSHLLIVAFISFTLGDGSKNITVIYVKGCFSCVFLEKLYIIQLYI